MPHAPPGLSTRPGSLLAVPHWPYTIAMTERVGLYGGSFNPIHCAHLIVARAVAEHFDLTRVILLPSAQPPHKQTAELLPAKHRVKMIRLAIQDEHLFELSDFDLKTKGPSYTIETVQHFRESLGAQVELHWIIGADSLAELVTWHRVPELVEACRLVTAVRPGWEEIDWAKLRSVLGRERTERLRAGLVQNGAIDISSTDIRSRLARNRSIRYLVPDDVAAYIERNRLYRDRAPRPMG